MFIPLQIVKGAVWDLLNNLTFEVIFSFDSAYTMSN